MDYTLTLCHGTCFVVVIRLFGNFAETEKGSLKVREHPLHAGAVFGMTDMMLGLSFRATYTTTSFVHLFFFDRR